MADTKEKNPKVVTIYGRLSFPTLTAQAAYEQSQKGSYPAKDVSEAAPNFQLLLETAQLNKIRSFVEDTFLPYCVKQHEAGEKRDSLDAKEVKALIAQINEPDFDGNYNTPFKPVHEKTAPLAPETVATVKVIGNKGVDMDVKAIVNADDELAVPDPDILKFPVIKPIGQTVHSLYPGCYVAVTLNLYAYHNGKLPGFSAGASVAIFKADGDRFGGGVTVDEDEIFAD